eukprot:gnl/Trimastix_PCT/2769.p1 GENE.gnl/Trimastix_PCT/2769~~gnl/Trimastix_PCT/2769.p1  ORF type:complete len:1640 (+),score=488.07 gnl/Trimastix_PCT/2769:47-4966(+)
MEDERPLEEIYQKKTQLEHILLRPDTYIGSVEQITDKLWVIDDSGESPCMVERDVSYVPGLYKIFDEILVNASDNRQRDPSMKVIRVTIDPEANLISVMNDGNGIPVEMHREEQVYIPELIFGHLLTSSHYDDSEMKVTGGRNGYGAKLANIFSTFFEVETLDRERGMRYKQHWTDNMTEKSEPEIRSDRRKTSYTKISFSPDLAKFGMERLDDDIIALLSKRVYDVAGCNARLKVELNGRVLPVRDFRDYVSLYFAESSPLTMTGGGCRVYEASDRWEVIATVSDGMPRNVSFVNGICTSRGGTHVKHVTEQIVDAVMASMKIKAKTKGIQKMQVRNNLCVFVRCLIVNPAFDSQTKETLTTRVTSFGSRCELSETFIKNLLKSGLLTYILESFEARQQKAMKKKDGSKRARVAGIPKLDDANYAGTAQGHECTLILTEGDSAKATATAGLTVLGRDYYGVYPLRGKVLNVRDATPTQILNNPEITNLKKILGLRTGTNYEDPKDVKSLRYGHVMIMADQDFDGSHIKALIINVFHKFWPALLRHRGFLTEFITPIVKVTRGRKNGQSFFTIPEYERWRQTHNNGKGFNIKYYKGLGTSTRTEAQEYFSDMPTHKKRFMWGSEDVDGDLIDLAFRKTRVEDRKQWMNRYEEGTYLDQSRPTVRYDEFINRELVLYSIDSTSRSIPSVVDGLKPSQRKIMFACFKRKLKKDIKVAQLSGYAAEVSSYHHGEAALAQTIIGLAQDFIGSNNLPLLHPQGMFGTRIQGGHDASQPRYIFTRLSHLSRLIFPEADDALLHYLDDDGSSIEPRWYIPVLPMVLVNGAEGIGTGYSTLVPNYNPRDIIANLRRFLAGGEMEPMHPWYRDFKGTIERNARAKTKGYTMFGQLHQSGESTVEVTELPIRAWTYPYKEFLESSLVSTENKDGWLKDYRDYHTDTDVHFSLTLAEGHEHHALGPNGYTNLGLVSKLSMNNLTLFTPDGKLRRYESELEIMQEFAVLRLDYYQKRKDHQLAVLREELRRLSNRMRFILMVVRGELRVNNRARAAIVEDLERHGFDRIAKASDNATPAEAEAEAEDAMDVEEEDESSDNEASDEDDDEAPHMPAKAKAKAKAGAARRRGDIAGYEYLLNMPIYSLTKEKVEALQAEHGTKEAEIAVLEGTTIQAMWTADLDALEEGLAKWEGDRAKNQRDATARRKKQQRLDASNFKPGRGRGRAKPTAKSAAPPPPSTPSRWRAIEPPAADDAKAKRGRATTATSSSRSTSASTATARTSVTKPTTGRGRGRGRGTATKATTAVTRKTTARRSPVKKEKVDAFDFGSDDDHYADPISDDDDDDAPKPAARKRAAPARKPKTTTITTTSRKRASAGTKTKAAASKRLREDDSESDSDIAVMDLSDEPPPPPPRAKAPARRAASKAATATVIESDDDSSSDDGVSALKKSVRARMQTGAKDEFFDSDDSSPPRRAASTEGIGKAAKVKPLARKSRQKSIEGFFTPSRNQGTDSDEDSASESGSEDWGASPAPLPIRKAPIKKPATKKAPVKKAPAKRAITTKAKVYTKKAPAKRATTKAPAWGDESESGSESEDGMSVIATPEPKQKTTRAARAHRPARSAALKSIDLTASVSGDSYLNDSDDDDDDTFAF